MLSSSVKQKTVATATLEAEYIAMSEVVREILWYLRLLNDLRFHQQQVVVMVDSQGAIDFAKNAQFSQRTKHIDIKYHFIRDHIEKGTIKLQYISTKENIADIFTKPLGKSQFLNLRYKMGMRSLKEIKDERAE